MEPTGLNISMALFGMWCVLFVINKLTENYGDDLPPTWPSIN